jgi:hypothetical protein
METQVKQWIKGELDEEKEVVIFVVVWFSCVVALVAYGIDCLWSCAQ